MMRITGEPDESLTKLNFNMVNDRLWENEKKPVTGFFSIPLFKIEFLRVDCRFEYSKPVIVGIQVHSCPYRYCGFIVAMGRAEIGH